MYIHIYIYIYIYIYPRLLDHRDVVGHFQVSLVADAESLAQDLATGRNTE